MRMTLIKGILRAFFGVVPFLQQMYDLCNFTGFWEKVIRNKGLECSRFVADLKKAATRKSLIFLVIWDLGLILQQILPFCRGFFFEICYIIDRMAVGVQYDLQSDVKDFRTFILRRVYIVYDIYILLIYIHKKYFLYIPQSVRFFVKNTKIPVFQQVIFIFIKLILQI